MVFKQEYSSEKTHYLWIRAVNSKTLFTLHNGEIILDVTFSVQCSTCACVLKIVFLAFQTPSREQPVSSFTHSVLHDSGCPATTAVHVVMSVLKFRLFLPPG